MSRPLLAAGLLALAMLQAAPAARGQTVKPFSLGRLCVEDATSAPATERSRWPDAATALVHTDDDWTIDWAQSSLSWSVAPTPWRVAGASLDFRIPDDRTWSPRPYNFGVSVLGVSASPGSRVSLLADGREIYEGPAPPPPGGMRMLFVAFDTEKPRLSAEVDRTVIAAATAASVVDLELRAASGASIMTLSFDMEHQRGDRLMREALAKTMADISRRRCT